MVSILQAATDLYQQDSVMELEINKTITTNEWKKTVSTYSPNEYVSVLWNEKTYTFYVIDGYDSASFQLIDTLCRSFMIAEKSNPIILVNKGELTNDLFSYLSLPVNGIVSEAYLLENFQNVFQCLKSMNIFYEPNFQKELVLKLERLKSPNKRINKLTLDDNKVMNILNKNEKQVLQLLLDGFNNREIAEALYFANSTVNNYVSDILKKVGARDRTQAVVKVIRNGWVVTVQ